MAATTDTSRRLPVSSIRNGVPGQRSVGLWTSSATSRWPTLRRVCRRSTLPGDGSYADWPAENSRLHLGRERRSPLATDQLVELAGECPRGETGRLEQGQRVAGMADQEGRGCIDPARGRRLIGRLERRRRLG